MYLKRLEMHGFKSFADRIDLHLPPGVTAIVGPNGSGKSNISDALRWVLGEQSVKSLRGLKMDDVIFVGSETRKPLGMAEVTIVLDNSDGALPLDYHEVAITRRLYRSGECEYLINRSSVRLRDIHELLFDTGLGKEAYSVIGQGKIDAILSAKAEDRRSIFEEAAGIVKYKNKKMLAMKKLAETENHLLRVEDIIQELSGQIGPLREQAEVAKEYLALQDELRNIEVNYTQEELNKLEAEYNQLAATLADAASKLEDEKRRELAEEAKVEELRLSLTQLEETIAQLQENLLNLTGEKGRLAGENEVILQKIRSQENRTTEVNEAIQRSQDRERAVADELNARLAELATLRQKIQEVTAEFHRAEETLQAQTGELNAANGELEAAHGRVFNLHNQLNELKNQSQGSSLQREFLERQINEQAERKQVLEENILRLQAEIEALEQANAEKIEEENRLKQKKTGTEQVIADSQRLLAEAEEELRQTQHAAERLAARLNLLEEWEKSYQGYFHGVKAVLTGTKQEVFHREIHGVVAELIQVKKGFETAVEVALGSALQNIVIATDSGAEQAIAYLKKHNLGRATFLPLNLVSGEAPVVDHKILTAHQSQTALDALVFKDEYKKIMAYLLGNTLIAPDLKTAVALTRALGKRFRIVTVDGEIIAPGGAITGGSLDRRQTGILSRKREIEELSVERAAIQGKVAACNKTKEELGKRLADHRAELEKLTQSLHQAGLERSGLQKDLERLAERLGQVQGEKAAVEARLDSLNKEIQEGDRSGLGLQKKIAAAEEALAAEQALQKTWEEKVLLAQKLREESQNRLAELRAEKVRLEQEEAGKQDLLQGLEKQRRELMNEYTGYHSELQRIEEEILRLRSELEEAKAKLTSLDVEEASISANLAEIRNKRDKLRMEVATEEDQLRTLRQTQNSLQGQVHRLELQINKNRMAYDSLSQHMTESYGADWTSFLQHNWVAPPKPREHIETLRRNIRALGPVNVGAVEEYQRLKERSDFLQHQFTDLKNAKETLERVIAEIERTTRQRFLETFTQIRQTFIDIFTDLFEGGKADLFLMDPDDPLETGIEILAQPPGKRLQSLSLLSGGERAMTAIALLFAILKVKPSPFCILDEIDATLDDVNVTRFAELLAKFSQDLQFIVITHRRGTMEMANALYGVTMEELGVSKLISIDLQRKVG